MDSLTFAAVVMLGNDLSTRAFYLFSIHAFKCLSLLEPFEEKVERS